MMMISEDSSKWVDELQEVTWTRNFKKKCYLIKSQRNLTKDSIKIPLTPPRRHGFNFFHQIPINQY
jgi:hypothetical protein